MHELCIPKPPSPFWKLLLAVAKSRHTVAVVAPAAVGMRCAPRSNLVRAILLRCEFVEEAVACTALLRRPQPVVFVVIGVVRSIIVVLVAIGAVNVVILHTS